MAHPRIGAAAWLGAALMLLALACASTEEADDNPFRAPPGGGEPDALVSGPGGGTPGGPADVGDITLAIFRVGADTWLSRANGTNARPVCEGAAGYPNEDGSRLLCVPDDGSQPLILYDVEFDLVVRRFEGWRGGLNTPPRLAPDGRQVAFSTLSEDFRDVIRVVDDGGNLMGEAPGFEVLAFPGPGAVLIDNNSATLWNVVGRPITLTGTGAVPVGPDPAGVVYQQVSPGPKVFWLDADLGTPAELGGGDLAGTFKRRVLIKTEEKARVIDLRDDRFDVDFSLPRAPFDKQLGVRLTGLNGVAIEEQVFSTCADGQQQRVAVKTRWRDLLTDETHTLAQDDVGHQVQVDGAGRRALVLAVDGCQVPLGDGLIRLVEDEDAAPTALSDLVRGPVRAALLSPDGKWVAVGLDDGVTIIDAESGAAQVVATGGVGGALHFR